MLQDVEAQFENGSITLTDLTKNESSEEGVTLQEVVVGRSYNTTSTATPSRSYEGSHYISVAWNNVSYDVTMGKGKEATKKTLLSGVTGAVLPGQVLAIMGGSGAGKSTLLDILAGRKQTGDIGGQVLYNGKEGKERSRYWLRRHTAYVTQEDVLMSTQTVEEELMFYASITLGLSGEERRQHVGQVMKELRIEHVANTTIGVAGENGGGGGGGGGKKKGGNEGGRLSGGERKRVAIAQQLLRNPRVLFLDEPTSGLDAHNSVVLMNVLRQVASERGMTIVCSIHQPRSSLFEMFDKLLLLKKGKTAYFGNASEAVEYFGGLGYAMPMGCNPADFFIDTLLGDESASTDFAGMYEQSEWAKRAEMVVADVTGKASMAELPLPRKRRSPFEKTKSGEGDVKNGDYDHDRDDAPFQVGYAKQIGLLIQRLFWVSLRNPAAFIVNVAQSVVMGVLVGSIFYQLGWTARDMTSRTGLVFMTLVSGAFPITSLAALLAQERNVIRRERAAGVYHVASYYVARTVLDIPICFILPVIFNSLLYWMAGLRAEAGYFFGFVGVAVLNCLVAGSLYTVLGAVSPDAVVANILSFIVTVIFMLFTGFLVIEIPKWWIWLEYMSFLKYGFQAQMLNQFQGIGPEGTAVLALFNLTDIQMWQPLVALACQVVIYRILGFVAYTFMHTEKR